MLLRLYSSASAGSNVLSGNRRRSFLDSRFDELDARGFQWLEKSPREPQSHAIAVPELAAVPGRKSQEVRLGLALAFEVVDERSGGLVVTEMAAAIDVAISNTMLQRYAPLPAGSKRRRPCIRSEIAGGRAGNRHRAIAGQPAGPVFVARLERALDEQAAEARTIDEELAVRFCLPPSRSRFDESIFAAQVDVDDARIDVRRRRASARNPRSRRANKAASKCTAQSNTERPEVGFACGRVNRFCPHRATASEYAENGVGSPSLRNLSQYWWNATSRAGVPNTPKG